MFSDQFVSVLHMLIQFIHFVIVFLNDLCLVKLAHLDHLFLRLTSLLLIFKLFPDCVLQNQVVPHSDIISLWPFYISMFIALSWTCLCILLNLFFNHLLIASFFSFIRLHCSAHAWRSKRSTFTCKSH